MSYVTKRWTMGVRPVRLQGQFQVHNPNLPLASLTFRDDLAFYMGAGFTFELSDLLLSVGAIGSYSRRKETLAEASLVDFASKAPSDLIFQQRLNGIFGDVGASLEWPRVFVVSGAFRDLGQYFTGDYSAYTKYLFVNPNRIPRAVASVNFVPPVWVGNLQIGAELITLLTLSNSLSDQWFGTVSYYVGSLRLLSGFRPGLLRTGIGLRFAGFEMAVAQEWINKIETGREAQPRFTLGITAGI